MDIKINDKVKLKYSSEDLESLDLGASGIVIHSPLKQFSSFLDDIFVYRGTLKENDEHCFISLYSSLRTSNRIYMITKNFIEKIEED